MAHLVSRRSRPSSSRKWRLQTPSRAPSGSSSSEQTWRSHNPQTWRTPAAPEPSPSSVAPDLAAPAACSPPPSSSPAAPVLPEVSPSLPLPRWRRCGFALPPVTRAGWRSTGRRRLEAQPSSASEPSSGSSNASSAEARPTSPGSCGASAPDGPAAGTSRRPMSSSSRRLRAARRRSARPRVGSAAAAAFGATGAFTTAAVGTDEGPLGVASAAGPALARPGPGSWGGAGEPGASCTESSSARSFPSRLSSNLKVTPQPVSWLHPWSFCTRHCLPNQTSPARELHLM
mmetsp:Transcript_110133/g.344602  ORF Transcript_110133/g.344602 Transcript_110133/m.344602 type:complete len:287 (+) Transcript_110133:513-1373(+)